MNLSLFLFLFLHLQSFAETTNYNPLPVEVQAGDRLRVRNFVGSIKLTGNAKAKMLTVRVRQANPEKLPALAKSLLDEWSFTVQREGAEIEMIVKSPSSKQNWRQLLVEGGIPRFELEISGPSIPANLTVHRGSIKISQWDAAVYAATSEGSASLDGGNGEAVLIAQNGDVSAKLREGSVRLETFNGRLEARQIKGRLDAENFSGESEIVQIEGATAMRSSRGGAKISRVRGPLEIYNGRGSFRIEALEGSLRGQLEQGALTAEIVGEADVRLNSKEGPISIAAQNSGASVNLGTKEGSFSLPGHLSAMDTANLKLVQGRLRGSNKGNIHIRTESGSIRVR